MSFFSHFRGSLFPTALLYVTPLAERPLGADFAFLGPFGAFLLLLGSLFPIALLHVIPLSERPLGSDSAFWAVLGLLGLVVSID